MKEALLAIIASEKLENQYPRPILQTISKHRNWNSPRLLSNHLTFKYKYPILCSLKEADVALSAHTTSAML